MIVKWLTSGIRLQISSIIVALLVAAMGGGTLISVAWDNYTGWHSASYPRDVIGPIIGVIGVLLFLALAALIATPVRFYRIPLINVAGKILSILLFWAGMLGAILAMPLIGSDIDDISTSGYAILITLMALLAGASAAIMFLKATRAEKLGKHVM